MTAETGPDDESMPPEKKKPRKCQWRKAKAPIDEDSLRRSPRNKQKQIKNSTENDKDAAVKQLFAGDSDIDKSPPLKPVATLPEPKQKPPIEIDNSPPLVPVATLPNPSAGSIEPGQKPPFESDTKAVDNIDNSPPLVPVATMPNPLAGTALDNIDNSDPLVPAATRPNPLAGTALDNIDNSEPLVPAATMPNPLAGTALDNIDNSQPLVPAATMPNPPTDELVPSQNQPSKSHPKDDSDDDDVKPSARKRQKTINDDDPDDEKTESEPDFPGMGGSNEKDSDEEDEDDADELETYLNNLKDSSLRRKDRGPNWYSDLREARSNMTPEDLKEEKRLIKKKTHRWSRSGKEQIKKGSWEECKGKRRLAERFW
jgi:hypothetical protein